MSQDEGDTLFIEYRINLLPLNSTEEFITLGEPNKKRSKVFMGVRKRVYDPLMEYVVIGERGIDKDGREFTVLYVKHPYTPHHRVLATYDMKRTIKIGELFELPSNITFDDYFFSGTEKQTLEALGPDLTLSRVREILTSTKGTRLAKLTLQGLSL
jgi:hypothetical protein